MGARGTKDASNPGGMTVKPGVEGFACKETWGGVYIDQLKCLDGLGPLHRGPVRDRAWGQ